MLGLSSFASLAKTLINKKVIFGASNILKHCPNNSGRIHRSHQYHLWNKKVQHFSTQKVFNQADLEYLKTLSEQAESYYSKQEFSKARDALKKSADLILSLNGGKDTNYARIINNIGITYKLERKYNESIQYLHKSVDILNNIEGNFEIEKAYTIGEIGQIYLMQKDYEKAQKSLKESAQVLSINKRDTIELASLYGMLGHIYKESKKFESAIENFQKELQLAEKLKGTRSRQNLHSLNELGQCFVNLSKFDKALETYKSIYEIEASKGNQTLGTAQALINTAMVYKMLNNQDEYTKNFQKGLQVVEKVNGKDHPDLIPLLQNLGMSYFQNNELDKSLPLLERCAEMLKSNQSKLLNYGTIISVIGNIYRKRSLFPQALKYYQQSLSIFENNGNNQFYIGLILSYIGDAHYQQKQFELSLKYFLNSLEFFQKIHGKNNLKNLELYFTISSNYHQLGNKEQSQKYAKLAEQLQIEKQLNGKQ